MAQKTKHIGIVACSAEGATLCYKTVCIEGGAMLGPYAHPEISMHGHSLADYTRCLDDGDLDGVAELMLSSAEKLGRAGADFLICPDNTIHQAYDRVVPRSSLPWLHIAEVVADEAKRRGFRRIGITGTRWLLDSNVYPAKLEERGLDWRKPAPETRDALNQIIINELVHGVFKPDAVSAFQRAMKVMKDDGCDAVVLGCTEIPLIMNDANSPLPTLDSTRLLARSALKMAMENAT
jgi:aspartate racemase